jgi:hypothetical protein
MNSKYLKEIREKALEVTELKHTGMEAREVIKDLLNIAEQAEALFSDRVSDGADQRVLQRRYDALKIEAREMEKKLQTTKDMLTTKMAIVIKHMSAEVTNISDADCAGRIKSSIKQLVEILTKL